MKNELKLLVKILQKIQTTSAEVISVNG